MRTHCQMLVFISGAVRLKKEGERWRMNIMSASKDFVTGENSDRVNALIREKRQVTNHELSGILNISDGSVKGIKQRHQYSKVCA